MISQVHLVCLECIKKRGYSWNFTKIGLSKHIKEEHPIQKETTKEGVGNVGD